MRVVYVPGLEQAILNLIGANAAVLADGKVAESIIPAGIARLSDVAAVEYRPRPALLWDFGAAEPPYPNPDGWIASGASGSSSAEASCGGVTARVDAPVGVPLWAGSSIERDGGEGSYPDAAGRPHATFAEEAVASLGLSATDPADFRERLRTALYAGGASGASVTVSGLDPAKSYDLHYFACCTQNADAAFQLAAGGYSGRPRVAYAAGSSPGGWTELASAEGRVSQGAWLPLAVRVTSLRPNADGLLSFATGTTVGNVLCVAEYEAVAHAADVDRIEERADALEKRVAALEAAS